MTVAAGGVGKGMGQCTPLPYTSLCSAPPCILFLLERIDLTGEAHVDVTGLIS